MTQTQVKHIIDQASEIAPRLQPLNAAEFLSRELPPRQNIIDPWLPEKGLVMLVAPRGIGKTLFALSAAYAASCGGRFLDFEVPVPCRTLYIDGEMPARAMQERLAAAVQSFEKQLPVPDYFRILAADLTEGGLPDLGTPEGQAEIDAQVGDSQLIVVDNLSTLVRSGKENEAESWSPVQDWVLKHRRAGRSVLLVHHAGKNGTPRGTSKREDVLDTIIALRRPQNYSSDQGARFEVHFEKARGFYGDCAQPFEAMYELRDSVASWSRKAIDDVEMLRVVDALESGLSLREAAKEHGLSKSKVHRLKMIAVQKGLLHES